MTQPFGPRGVSTTWRCRDCGKDFQGSITLENFYVPSKTLFVDGHDPDYAAGDLERNSKLFQCTGCMFEEIDRELVSE